MLYNIPGKIEICINMPNIQKHTKYAKTCKIIFHIFNRGTLKWILCHLALNTTARLICKCMNLRALIIAVGSLCIDNSGSNMHNFICTNSEINVISAKRFRFFFRLIAIAAVKTKMAKDDRYVMLDYSYGPETRPIGM
jgi:hypothetical protein